VINVGYAPTFGPGGLAIEAHLLDYAGGPLYGALLVLEMVEKLRDEQRFDTVEALLDQIRHDIARARRLLEPEVARARYALFGDPIAHSPFTRDA